MNIKSDMTELIGATPLLKMKGFMKKYDLQAELTERSRHSTLPAAQKTE